MKQELEKLLVGILEEADETELHKIRISENKMEAYITLVPPKEDAYTFDEIEKFLKSHQVKNGIIRKNIEEAIKEKNYKREILVAKGKEATNGKNGYYEFFFDTICAKTPEVLENGRVDYHKIHNFEGVNEGDLLAKYNPATNGQYGYTVSGDLIKPVNGKDAPKLLGKGFLLKDNQYFAQISGKIELKNQCYLYIEHIYEVKGDVDFAEGDIDFDGDVVIRGNVLKGFTIKATGNIIVDGNVESAVLISGRDIVLREGMLGNMTGVVQAKEYIYGKFLEACTISAGETIYANYFMNCNVRTFGKVVLTGNKGYLLGGEIKAVKGIIANKIGNLSELYTKVSVGVDEEMLEEIEELKKEIVDLTAEINREQKRLKAIESNDMERLMFLRREERYIQLVALQTKKIDQREEKLLHYQEMKKLMADSNRARISVKTCLYPGVMVEFGSYRKRIVDQLKRVTVMMSDGNLVYTKYMEND